MKRQKEGNERAYHAVITIILEKNLNYPEHVRAQPLLELAKLVLI